MARAGSVQRSIEEAIQASTDTVFLMSELAASGGYTQVQRAVRKMTQQGKLTRLGYGVYAKMEDGYKPGSRILAAGDFSTAATRALDKLNVGWKLGDAYNEYNSGRSTQVPANFIVQVDRRFRRKIAYKKAELNYERPQSKTSA